VKVARTIADARAALARPAGSTLGFVPTMGALHRGHLALVEAATGENDLVAVSIFVNPAQFGPQDDLDRYPRDEARDLRLLAEAGVDIAFLPAADDLYPPGFATWVEVGGVTEGLEGAARPGHFRAVATVCLKLFHIVEPDRVYFGLKDAQQAEVIRTMIRDLDLPLELRAVGTVRDDDGVALSSRNAYLSGEEREAARALPRALGEGARAHAAGRDAVAAALDVLAAEPRLRPEYVEVARWNGALVLAAAVRAGPTRLIDNVVLEEEPR
jgi:pantoate--beta-alanine ligase